MNGYISIHRKLKNHWIWNEKRKFSRAEAWIDILMTVNFANSKTVKYKNIYDVNRGECISSLQDWANRWRWNKSKVKYFFNVLEKDGMIEVLNEVKTTRLKVLNYDEYQLNVISYVESKPIKKTNRKTENKVVEIPNLSEFLNYAKQKDVDFDLKKKNIILKYESWKENDWKDGYDKKIKNWKSKLLNNLPYIQKELKQKIDRL